MTPLHFDSYDNFLCQVGCSDVPHAGASLLLIVPAKGCLFQVFVAV